MKISHCRLCQSARIEKVIDLGFHPLADTFLPAELLYGPEVSYPLQLASCQDCGHVFTLFPVTPEDRYQKQDYSYDSSNSAVSVRHFKEFRDAAVAALAPPVDGLIVDIGSNVGTLLGHFKAGGHANVLGVEPAGNIARLAEAAGVPTLNHFFDAQAAALIRARGPVHLLLSSNVVNHADDLVGLLGTAKEVLAPQGHFVFEVPYLLDLVQGLAFDTIYHEHVHYYGLKALAHCLEGQGFAIFKVERLDYMCGSIRVYARLGGAMAPELAELIAEEVKAGLYELATYREFMRRIEAMKFDVLRHLAEIRAKGGKIIGIGAATKGNTFLNYCRLDGDLIAYITDASPLKIGKLTPGSHIPIVADEAIDAAASHALILPWNIAAFLKNKLAHLGLEFYVPQINPSHPVAD